MTHQWYKDAVEAFASPAAFLCCEWKLLEQSSILEPSNYFPVPSYLNHCQTY